MTEEDALLWDIVGFIHKKLGVDKRKCIESFGGVLEPELVSVYLDLIANSIAKKEGTNMTTKLISYRGKIEGFSKVLLFCVGAALRQEACPVCQSTFTEVADYNDASSGQINVITVECLNCSNRFDRRVSVSVEFEVHQEHEYIQGAGK